jgi:glucose/arabinose dehydrogenase
MLKHGHATSGLTHLPEDSAMNYIISKIGYFLSVGICGLPIIGCAGMAEVAAIPKDAVAALSAPPGFSVQVFAKADAAGATYFSGPRFMAFDAAGNLYLSAGMQNKVVMLPDRNKDGVADEVVTVADGLNAPQGLAFVGNKLLIANQDGVVALEQKNGHWGKPVDFIKNLPTGGHTLKTIRLGPDGYLYLSVGSSCNVCEESDATRATILRYTITGKPAGALTTVGRHAPSAIWASGLRNSQGLAWHPRTHVMFATNNGADMRSDTKGGKVNDELPPEHLNIIEAGKHYGWPHCWGDQVTDPNFPGDAGFCKTMQTPAITFTSHSTPIGITFLDKAAFPAEYKDDAIIALHGSWNREQPSGYKLVRVKFHQDKPVEVTDFVTGWLSKDGTAAKAWGRPVDVVVGPDGALYVSDDRAGMVYRITYNMKIAK